MIRKSIFLAVIGTFLFSLGACHKFEGGQSVPAYIRIDSITLECDYGDYGANTSKFTDAWVYIDDQIIGCYELPATFPVLKKGKHKVSVSPGISVNGIGSSRSFYVFCRPTVYEQLELVEDSIVKLSPVVNYYPIGEGFNKAWMEDFESSIGLEPTSDSDTGIVRVSDAASWHSPNSYFSGRVTLPPDSLDFTIATIEELRFHNELEDGYAMLEMDYNTNDTFFVGLMYYKENTLTRWPLLKVLPTDKTNPIPSKWNKIYINVGHVMKRENDASYFKLYLTSDLTVPDEYGESPYKPLNEQRYYYFDNLKLIYRPR